MTEGKTIIPTTCWECSTHCGAFATVENGRVTKIVPNADHPASLGAFCVKGMRGLPELTYHPDRILYPMRRSGARGGGGWERISWDDALDEMTDRLLAAGLPIGPVRNTEEVMSHPHTIHRQMAVEKDGYRSWGIPIKFRRTPGAIRSRPPRFAEHSREILAEHGFSPEEIDRLAAEEIVVEKRRKV